MTLVSVTLQILCAAILICTMKSKPVTQEHSNIYYDCCDVGIDENVKEDCKIAAGMRDHVITLRNGDTKTFLWSSCRPGKEPWKKYEKD